MDARHMVIYDVRFTVKERLWILETCKPLAVLGD